MLSADGKHRYEYFIHRVCDTRKIWGLYHDGWATLGSNEKKLLPFWPHQAYADRFKKDGWSSYLAKEIDLTEFLERWIPDMRSGCTEVAIFPVGSGSSVVVSLDDLEANIRHELFTSYGEED